MRKLIVTTFVTLDGVMQAPGGPEEDHDRRFYSWRMVVQLLGRHDGARSWAELMAKPSELLLGRKTFEIFAAHWPIHIKMTRLPTN